MTMLNDVMITSGLLLGLYNCSKYTVSYVGNVSAVFLKSPSEVKKTVFGNRIFSNIFEKS